MKGVCPYCEDFREIEIIRKMEKSMIRGREIASDAEFSLCTACGKDISCESPQAIFCPECSKWFCLECYTKHECGAQGGN